MKTASRTSYKNVKTFLIARVSDPSQREALPAQKLRLDEYSERLELDSEYYEFDETAYKATREEFIAIVNNATQYKGFYIFVFDKIDRLTRDVSSEVVRKLKELAYGGVCELHFPSDGLVLHKDSPAHDKTRFDMGMVFGGYYSMAISDNVKRKIQQKLHDGEFPGKAPVGYMNVATKDDFGKILSKNIVPDPTRSPYIVKAFELRLEGNSFRTIAKILKEDGFRSNTKKLGVVTQAQIETMLKNPFYHGVMKYDGGLYPHKYEPVVDKRLFDNVQTVNETRNVDRGKTKTKQTYTFQGVLKCATCGCSYSSYTKKGNVYLRCTKSKEGIDCDQPPTSEAHLTPQVTALLEKLAISEQIVNKLLDTMKEKHDKVQLYYKNAIEESRKKIEDLDKKLGIIYSDRLDGRITPEDYDKYRANYEADKKKEEDNLVNLTNDDTSFIVTSEYLLKLAQNANQIFKSSQPAQKNRILKTLLANCKINEKRLQLSLLQPFSVLCFDTNSLNWLRRLDSNQQPRS